MFPDAEYLTKVSLDENEIMVAVNKGYVVVPQKISLCYRLNDFEVRLLINLIAYMGHTGYAYAGHKKLAFINGKKSTTTIKNTLSSLNEKGFLTWRIGGGDSGTNHYYLNHLLTNPYIIMSEATHFVIKEILSKYRNTLPYEKLYGYVLDFIYPKEHEKDLYQMYLDHLKEVPEDRKELTFYYNFALNLSYYVSEKSSFKIDINWYDVLFKHFKNNFPSIMEEFNHLKDSSIFQKIPHPIVEDTFEVSVPDYYHQHRKVIGPYLIKAWEYVTHLNKFQVNQEFHKFYGSQMLFAIFAEDTEKCDDLHVYNFDITSIGLDLLTLKEMLSSIIAEYKVCELKGLIEKELLNPNYDCPI